MNLPTAIRTVRWMVWDTFRQAVASRLLWVILAVTAVCAAVCFSVRVTGDEKRFMSEAEVRAALKPEDVRRLGLEELVRMGGIGGLPHDYDRLTVKQRQKAFEEGRKRAASPDWKAPGPDRYRLLFGLEVLKANGKLQAIPVDLTLVPEELLQEAKSIGTKKLAEKAELPPNLLLQLGVEVIREDGLDGEIAALPVEWDQLTPEVQEAAYLAGVAKAKHDGVRVISGEVSFGFGSLKSRLGRNREDAVRHLQVWLATLVGDTAGILLALLWTAGFLPGFLEPQSATVLLAKPTPRWSILLGKYAGVVFFVTIMAFVFIGSTWLGLGLSTGVWSPAYWLAVPLLAINFAIFYAVSTFLAVWTRNGVVCAFGTLLFWIICWAINFAHHKAIANPMDAYGPGALMMLDIGYWVMPKPLDMSAVFFDALQAEGFAGKVPELQKVQQAGRFHPEWSIAASLAFALGVLGLSAYEFKMTDY